MGQREVLEVLAKERKLNNHSFLTPKEIQQAMENLGYMLRIENVNKSIKKVRNNNTIEIQHSKNNNKRYRLKKTYRDIYL